MLQLPMKKGNMACFTGVVGGVLLTGDAPAAGDGAALREPEPPGSGERLATPQHSTLNMSA